MLRKLGLTSSDLSGKVAVVTGAGQGIGKELAIALSMLGAAVVVAEIKDTGAEVEAIIRSQGGQSLFVKADVSDENSVRGLFEKSVKAFGKVDILVNNAIVVATGSILELPASAWDRVFAVNLKGPVLLIKAFLPPMLERKNGVIVNVLSSEGMAYLAPYAASKAALQSMSSSLVAELGDDTGVIVFNFAPGMIDTPTFNAAAQQVAPRMGMTPDQFKHLGVNPGYEGMMPAEDCAAGFAWDIVHAKEYHGQTADPFKPFMQAGTIRMTTEAEPKQASSQIAGAVVPENVIELGRELQNVLSAVNKETEELDLFKKTWMKNDFNRKAGGSIKDWVSMSADLTKDLEELTRSGGNGRTGEIKAKFPYVIARLEKLSAYFNAQAENAKGYFKDPNQRDAAIAALAERENTARSMANALKDLSK